jgi:hypothetical protein
MPLLLSLALACGARRTEPTMITLTSEPPEDTGVPSNETETEREDETGEPVEMCGEVPTGVSVAVTLEGEPVPDGELSAGLGPVGGFVFEMDVFVEGTAEPFALNGTVTTEGMGTVVIPEYRAVYEPVGCTQHAPSIYVYLGWPGDIDYAGWCAIEGSAARLDVSAGPLDAAPTATASYDLTLVFRDYESAGKTHDVCAPYR